MKIANPLFSQDFIESYSLFDTPNGLQLEDPSPTNGQSFSEIKKLILQK
jgi:hypothetical protein